MSLKASDHCGRAEQPRHYGDMGTFFLQVKPSQNPVPPAPPEHPLIPSSCLVSFQEAACVNSWHLYRLVTKRRNMTSLRNVTLRELQLRPLLQTLVLTPGFQAPLLLHISRVRGHISCASHFPAAFLDSLSFASTGISLQSHSAPSEQTLHTLIKDGPAELLGISTPSPINFKCLGRSEAAKMPQQIIRSQENSPSSVFTWMRLFN